MCTLRGHLYTTTHKPLFKEENAEWRHTSPEAACCLVHSMQSNQISLLECHEFTQFVRAAFFSLNTERQ